MSINLVYGQGNKLAIHDLKIKAQESYLTADFSKALSYYHKLLKSDSTNSDYNYYIGYCYLKIGSSKSEATPYFERAILHSNRKKITISLYYLGVSYMYGHQLDKAIEAFKKYETAVKSNIGEILDANRQIAMCKNARYFMKYPRKVSITNPGAPLNSTSSDYAPLINIDNSSLVFTSQRKGSTGGYLNNNGEIYSDIYISKNNSGTWSKPKKISSIINSVNSETCVFLSGNSDELIYTKDDIYTNKLLLLSSTKRGKSFAKPTIFDLKYNIKCQANYVFITNNGETIFFASNQKGSCGANDIWKVTKDSTNVWGRQINLGPTVNTPYNEEAPFVTSDGKTLYFSSKGHNSLGGYDLFKSNQTDSGKWSKAVNLEYPINSTGNEIYYNISKDGTKSYFSSDRDGGLGGFDIYIIESKKEIAFKKMH
ncbi:MAG: PD40 domain-containing protein [Bacteroidia bacterium]|nr:PD40 domain-containing protein [Bacteroidia bacterium]